MESAFFNQIVDNLEEYKVDYPNNSNMQRYEWSFNYWILDKLFNIDESLIFDQIIDVHDKGIDCYHFDDDNSILYLIQNKFYDPSLSSELTVDYVQDLAVLPLGLLDQGKYNHCKELQDIYSKIKRRKNYKIIFSIYITKKLEADDKKKLMRHFGIFNNPNVDFEIYDLDDIHRIYYSDYSDGVNKNMEFNLSVSTEKSIMDMNDKTICVPIHAKYIMVPIIQFYEMMDKAKNSGYNLFDENIRDYLGSNGKINSKIKETLNDPEDMKYFVYYNNGITVVCSSVAKDYVDDGNNKTLLISNPKIVNGCQTVSTIYEVLNNYKWQFDNLDIYKNVYVMAKFLDSSSIENNKPEITKNIVQRNNSQNSIDISIFNIRKEELIRIQKEFLNKGFLLMIKQSDKNTFANEYKGAKFEEIKNLAASRINKFGLSFTKLNQYMIPLDKFLQVVYCFYKDAYYAYTRKSKVIKDIKVHNEIIEYIMEHGVLENYLDLYLLYIRAEQDRKNKLYGDDRTPIPLYLVDFFARLECDSRNIVRLSENLKDNNSVTSIIKKYSNFTRGYAAEYLKNNGVDYNKMIKQKIDDTVLATCKNMYGNIIV